VDYRMFVQGALHISKKFNEVNTYISGKKEERRVYLKA
jgi:hypothetical protein